MAAEHGMAVAALNRSFLAAYPGEVGRELSRLEPSEAARFLAAQDPMTAAGVIVRMLPGAGAEALARLPDDACGAVLGALDPARAAALLSRLDENLREGRLALVSDRAGAEIRALIAYPLDSAGHWMDPRVNAFLGSDRVSDVLERLRRLRDRRVHDLYLVDEEGHLVGAVRLQDVALADPDDPLDVHANRGPARIDATASREEVLEELQTRRVPALPVVDVDGHLLGVIRHDAIVEAAREQASAGIQTMVGASADERALSPPWFAVRKRLPWLQINLLTAFLAASVVGLFEETIARFTALAVLLPVVAGQSGNTGAQALAVTMRGLALREVRARHWLRVAGKEVAAAACNGVAVALTTAAGVWVWSDSLGLTLVIGVSMVISMVMAGLAGALIPMALTSLGQDPAQSSSIILTTVTDVVGFLSFLGIATALAFML